MFIEPFQLDHDSPTAPGLVGLWGPGPVWENDISGRGGNGILAAGVQRAVDPEYGNVLYFDGVAANVVTLADFPYFEAISNFSIVLRVKITDATRDNDLVVKGDHAGGEPFVLWFDNSGTDHWQFLITDSDSDYSGVKSSAHVPVGLVWYHLVFTFEPEKARLYIDGVEDGNSPFALPGIGNVENTVDLWRLGNNVGGDARLTGYLATTRFYDRTISSAEAQYIYQETKSNPFSDVAMRPRRVFKGPAVAGFISQKALIIGGGILGI